MLKPTYVQHETKNCTQDFDNCPSDITSGHRRAMRLCAMQECSVNTHRLYKCFSRLSAVCFVCLFRPRAAISGKTQTRSRRREMRTEITDH